MMDVFYPLSKFSRWENNELKYSLRSIEKHLSNVDNVWIAGDLPDWIQNVKHLPHGDGDRTPENNVINKLRSICREEISDTFLFMNDDIYLLADMDAETIPYYYNGTLGDIIKERGNDQRGRAAKNTLKIMPVLLSGNVINFELHYPIRFKKKLLEDIFIPNEKYGYLIRSVYGNIATINQEQIQDCKHFLVPENPGICFSSFPTVDATVKKFLKERFPNKSKYEK